MMSAGLVALVGGIYAYIAAEQFYLDNPAMGVPHGFVHAFEKVGWVPEPHILSGIHHGDYAEAMRWGGEGEPVFPTKETEAST
jgi:hypothetical protein